MVELAHAYAFVGGAVVGRFTGILSSIVIGGILFYAADSSIFTAESMVRSKEIAVEFIQNFIK